MIQKIDKKFYRLLKSIIFVEANLPYCRGALDLEGGGQDGSNSNLN